MTPALLADGPQPSATAATSGSPLPATGLDEAGYRGLADFRFHVRRFFAFSEAATAAAGLAPAQYQAMLAIRAHPGPEAMTISLLARQLFIKLNSAVELVQRLQQAGFVTRLRSAADRRKVELALTLAGGAMVERLAAVHLSEHRRHLADLEAIVTLLAA